MKKHIVGENGISYTLGEDGLYYPDLKLPEETDYPIGKYGRMRRRYLQEYREVEYLRLFLNGGLNEHLHSVDVECQRRKWCWRRLYICNDSTEWETAPYYFVTKVIEKNEKKLYNREGYMDRIRVEDVYDVLST